jgi:acyl-CoA reductase-like NAD-dependent aldehyde dehydrogenase
MSRINQYNGDAEWIAREEQVERTEQARIAAAEAAEARWQRELAWRRRRAQRAADEIRDALDSRHEVVATWADGMLEIIDGIGKVA